MHGSAIRIAAAPHVVPKASPYPDAATAISQAAERLDSAVFEVSVATESPLYGAPKSGYEYHATAAHRVAVQI